MSHNRHLLSINGFIIITIIIISILINIQKAVWSTIFSSLLTFKIVDIHQFLFLLIHTWKMWSCWSLLVSVSIQCRNRNHSIYFKQYRIKYWELVAYKIVWWPGVVQVRKDSTVLLNPRVCHHWYDSEATMLLLPLPLSSLHIPFPLMKLGSGYQKTKPMTNLFLNTHFILLLLRESAAGRRSIAYHLFKSQAKEFWTCSFQILFLLLLSWKFCPDNCQWLFEYS